MRTFVSILLLYTAATAQIQLSGQDETEIRKAIEVQAAIENQRGEGRVWSERGPIMYVISKMSAIAPDVATADAEGTRIGVQFGKQQFVFILVRTNGRWRVARKIARCDLPPVIIQPVSGSRQSEAPGSLDCPG